MSTGPMTAATTYTAMTARAKRIRAVPGRRPGAGAGAAPAGGGGGGAGAAGARGGGGPGGGGVVRPGSGPPRQSDPRVEVAVEDVDHEVDQHEPGRDHQYRRLHDAVVAVGDRVDEQPPDARPREDGLDDHGAAEQRAELEPDDRHDRDERVA